jgi:alkylation response protein AidB-like acyl-CoA dehydrogenase
MKTESTPATAAKGGEWLIKETDPLSIFIPEDFSEEQKMVLDMCQQFMNTYVLPNMDRADKMEQGYMRSLLDKTAEQGLLSTNVPEKYGGFGKDFITNTIITEGMSTGGGYSIAYGVHANLGTKPILYFGTEEQRQKYIPKLATGEWIGAYGLTEPNSGSDALSAKTTARLSSDEKYYLLNGQKCWISNGGFADVFTVFAKVVDQNLSEKNSGFTAFIVERGFEGLTVGAEEHKMGIKSSSTVQLFFQDCKVPVENVLGEIGRGHLIAFNILNGGRFRLSAIALGNSKLNTTRAVQYAVTREQFKQPIASFGAIKHKLGEMAIRTWITESTIYRTARSIKNKEDELLKEGEPFNKVFMNALEEFAIECAMLKVYGTETLDFVVDEGVQIYGGNGFSDEYEISRAYRDSRVNRIFEGTNEINRLLLIDMVLKRAMTGRLDLIPAMHDVSKYLTNIPDFGNDNGTAFGKEKKYIANFKKALLMIAGTAAQKLMKKLEQEQELMMNLADITINIYTSESALLRVMKLVEIFGEAAAVLQTDMMRAYVYDAADRIYKSGKDALISFVDGDELKIMLVGLKRFTNVEPFNTKAARRRITDKLIEENKYCF